MIARKQHKNETEQSFRCKHKKTILNECVYSCNLYLLFVLYESSISLYVYGVAMFYFVLIIYFSI